MSGNASAALPLRRGMISITVMVAAVLQTLDNTIANVALPSMQGQLSATQDQISWVLTSYIVAAAIMTPLSGWLCARYGRKEVFAFSVGGFTLTSALCGIAQTLPEVVLFRTLQGIFGAALMPVSQSVLLDINPPEKQARAMAIWSLGAVVGPMIGPVLGGWLTDEYSWRWVFWINVPLGLLAFFGTLIYVPRTPITRLRFDLLGFALLALAVGSLQLMLDRGQLKDWFDSWEIVAEATVCGLALYLFVVHAATTPEPFLRLALLRDRNFMAGSALVFIVGIVLFSVMSLLPPLLQHLMGESPTSAGIAIGWRGVGSILLLIFVSRLAKRFDARWLILCGMVIMLWASWMLIAIAPGMDDRLIVLSSLIQGVGSVLIFVFVTTQSFATLGPELRSEGTAFFSLMRNLGASVGIAALQALFVSRAQGYHADLSTHVAPYGLEQEHPGLAAMLTDPQGLVMLNAQVTAQAEWISYITAFEVVTLVTLLAMPLVFLLRRIPRAAAPVAASAE
jgi:DHA2 family multidrug resistance protein